MTYPETLIDEDVKVWAFFDHGIFPIAMNWRRRFVKFEKVILVTSKKIGATHLVDLVCASDTANFQLEYNGDNHLWKVKKVLPKG